MISDSTSASILTLLGSALLGAAGPRAAMADPPTYTPRIVQASGAPAPGNGLTDPVSPYLALHRQDLVHWQPWTMQTIAAARAADKPLLVCVGFSTCSWCEAQHRDSFSDPSIASFMNENFTCVLVDREEYPEVDDVCIQTLRGMGRGAGWPLLVWFEPQSVKPFEGTGMLPTDAPPGQPSLRAVLNEVATTWRDNPESYRVRADQLGAFLAQRMSALAPAEALSIQTVARGVDQIMGTVDPQFGGFGNQQKFPAPARLRFLLSVGESDPTVLQAVNTTLQRMAASPLHDQVGGGFHRYTVDRQWQVPQFEKLLCDNAQIATAYLEAFVVTKNDEYADVARSTLDYILREMRGSDGLFYSSQDAAVNGVLGASYVWSMQEIEATLNDAGMADELMVARQLYAIAGQPNPGERGVLTQARTVDAVARQFSTTPEQIRRTRRAIREALLTSRYGRLQPITDDKAIAAWNGVTIEALALGSNTLQEPRYVEAAKVAASRFMATLADGTLTHSLRRGRESGEEQFEDYAAMMCGLLALHEVTGERRWADDAVRLYGIARARFWDTKYGGYFDTIDQREDMFLRSKSLFYDGSIPTGSGLMLCNLVNLYRVAAETSYLDDIEYTLEYMSPHLNRSPSQMPMALMALYYVSLQHAEYVPGLVPRGQGMKMISSPVSLSLEPTAIRLTPGVPATVTLNLQVREGYWIMSEDPGTPMVVATGIEVRGEGLELTAAFPDGQPLTGPLRSTALNVITGTMKIELTLTQTDVFLDPPELELTYQPCSADEVLAIVQVVLPLEITSVMDPE